MDGRTRVVLIDLAVAVSSLLIQKRLYLVRNEIFDSRSALVGAVEAFCVQYFTEHEPIASMVNSYTDRLLLSVCQQLFDTLLSRSGVSSESMGLGASIGLISYRFVFGVIRPVPEGRLQRASLLDRVRRSDGTSSD